MDQKPMQFSDEKPSPPEKEDDTPMSALSFQVGATLKAEREAKNRSYQETAKALKLSVRQIEAIEKEDWASLPCATILRGFIRNYAKFLERDPKPFMSALDALKEAPVNLEIKEISHEPITSSDQTKQIRKRDWVRVGLAFFFLLCVLLAYFFFPAPWWADARHFIQTIPDKIQFFSEEKEETAETLSLAASEAEEKPSVDAFEKSPEVITVLSPEASSPMAKALLEEDHQANERATLTFAFAQLSWVEIKDKTGAIIFKQANQPNTTQTVEGLPPFSLVIGNAGHVRLEYKGKLIDFSKRSRDDVARLTLE